MRNRLLALRSFYRWLVADGRRDDDPTQGLPVRHAHHLPRRPYTGAELRALLDACLSDRDRAMLIVLLATGLRISELLGMQVDDIDWVQGTVLVRGKGGKERWVALGRRAEASLREYVDGRRGAVWLTKTGQVVSRARARKNLYAIASRAGVARAYPHRFRITFANDILRAGADLGAVKEMMGHARIEQTAHYGGYTAQDRALEAQRRYNPADRLAG